MSYVKMMVHAVWSTKNRAPLIDEKLKPELLSHLKENSIKKEIFIDTMNCLEDHIHLLISLGSEQTISKVLQLIKGESSRWVNQQQLIKNYFDWQNDYFAVSVSESMIDTVRAYIKNQQQHHKQKSFTQEYDKFVKKYGFKIN